jgi:uncharacterized membrane protein YccC
MSATGNIHATMAYRTHLAGAATEPFLMAQHSHPSGAGTRALLVALGRDFAPWPGLNVRVIDNMACLVAVLLAIASSRLLDISNVGWAAFSAYMVIRRSLADSMARGVLRMVGTAIGVSLACVLAPHLLRATIMLSAGLALVGGMTLYRALLDRHGYGWLIAGLSFAMVLVDGMEHAHQALSAFAYARLAEVCVGSCAAMLVSAAVQMVVPSNLLSAAGEVLQAATTRPSLLCRQAALRHALQGAMALALIPWVWACWHAQALSQSSITIMVVLMVPMADLAAPAQPTSTRLRHRFLGCSIGGALASATLLISHASPILMTLAACAGVIVGRHIENGKLAINYAGTQLALAFLVVLVPDGYAGLDTKAGLERLIGIFLGMALLEPVRQLFRRWERLD